MSDTPTDIPESKWFFRRLYTFGVTIIALAIIGVIVWRAAAHDLVGIAYGLLAEIGWLSLLYLVAPSADEIARIVARIASLKNGTPEKD